MDQYTAQVVVTVVICATLIIAPLAWKQFFQS